MLSEAVGGNIAPKNFSRWKNKQFKKVIDVSMIIFTKNK